MFAVDRNDFGSMRSTLQAITGQCIYHNSQNSRSNNEVIFGWFNFQESLLFTAYESTIELAAMDHKAHAMIYNRRAWL